MSVREDIAKNIVETLKASGINGKMRYITREPFDFNKLSNAQFPAVLVRSSNEDREDATIVGSSAQRMSTVDYQLVCFVKAKAIDTARNKIIEDIEEALDTDRTRGGYAIDTQVTGIETDDGSIDPIGGVIITVRIIYQYTRGNA